MIFKKLIFVHLITLLFPLSWCFNIETSSGQLHYLQSPALKAELERVPGQPPLPDPYFPNIAPSFFGYDFSIQPTRSRGNFNVYAGAPRTADVSKPSRQNTSTSDLATGGIYACLYSSSSSSSPTCNSVGPTPSIPGDSFGLSVGLGRNGDLHACSPTKAQSCPPAAYSPGYCYRRNRNLWTEDPKTAANACPIVDLDIMFVLDGSQSVGANNFNQVKNWVVNVSGSFDISDGSTRIGVVQYSFHQAGRPLSGQTYIKTEVGLGRYRTQEDFRTAVNRISLQGFTTNTAHALNKTVLDFQGSPRFNDNGTSKVLILLTDGKSTDSEHLKASANYVRSLGITTFAVGVGEAEIDELKEIATGMTNSTERVYNVSNFDDLAAIASELRQAILNFALEGSTSTASGSNTFNLESAEYGFSMDTGRVRYCRRLRCTGPTSKVWFSDGRKQHETSLRIRLLFLTSNDSHLAFLNSYKSDNFVYRSPLLLRTIPSIVNI